MSGTRVPCSFVGLSGLASLERSNKRRAASDVLRGFQDREWRAGDVCVRAFKVDGQGTIVSFRHKAKVGAWDFTQVSLEGVILILFSLFSSDDFHRSARCFLGRLRMRG